MNDSNLKSKKNSYKRIILADPYMRGHHYIYFREMLRSLQNFDFELILMCPQEMYENLSTEEWDVEFSKFHFIDYAENSSSYVDRSLSLEEERTLRCKRLIKCLGELKYCDKTLLFLPFLDSYLSTEIDLSLFDELNCSISCIWFQPGNAILPHNSYYKEVSPKRIFSLGVFRSVGLLIYTERVQKYFNNINVNLSHIPDFIDTTIDENPYIEELKFKTKSKKTICLLGALAKRKGLLLLLETFDKYKLYNHYCLIIAGPLIDDGFSDEEMEFIEYCTLKWSDSIFYSPKAIKTEGEFNSYIKVSDIVWALYDNFAFSSNMIGKACYFNKWIIGFKDSYIGETIDQYKLGATAEYNCEDVHRFLASFDNGEYEVTSKTIEGRKKYLRNNSISKIKDFVLSSIEN